MREELDEHREVINENTGEIQTNFEFLVALDKRIDRLQDCIQELYLMVSGKEKKQYSISPLSAREKLVFLGVLSLTESFPHATYAQLAQHTGLSANVVGSYIARMEDKGIPFIKKRAGNNVVISFDKRFREDQIKKNIVGLEIPLTHWFS